MDTFKGHKKMPFIGILQHKTVTFRKRRIYMIAGFIVFIILLNMFVIKPIRMDCGDLDYELQLLKNWAKEFQEYRPLEIHPNMAFPNCFDNFACNMLSIFCPSDTGGTDVILWDDETHHPVMKRKVAEFVTIYVDGIPDKKIVYGSHYRPMYVSIAAMSFFGRNVDVKTLLQPGITYDEWNARSKFMSYLYLHDKVNRVKFRETLIDVIGAHVKKLKGNSRMNINLFNEAVEIQSEFRFCMEFDGGPPCANYLTEKIVNGFLSGCIPVFRGHSMTAKRFFNPKSYIDISDFQSFEDAARFIQKVDESRILAEGYLREPPLTEEGYRRFFWWRFPDVDSSTEFNIAYNESHRSQYCE